MSQITIHCFWALDSIIYLSGNTFYQSLKTTFIVQQYTVLFMLKLNTILTITYCMFTTEGWYFSQTLRTWKHIVVKKKEENHIRLEKLVIGYSQCLVPAFSKCQKINTYNNAVIILCIKESWKCLICINIWKPVFYYNYHQVIKHKYWHCFIIKIKTIYIVSL